jgi:hypothetical protein
VEVPASLFLETPLASTTSSAPKLDAPASPTETADKTEVQSPSMEANLPKQSLDPIASTTDSDDVLSPLVPVSDATTSPALDWSWTQDDNGKLRIEIQLPGLVRPPKAHPPSLSTYGLKDICARRSRRPRYRAAQTAHGHPEVRVCQHRPRSF